MKKLMAYTLLSVTIATVAPPFASAQNCTVQKHDSIWRIAKEYHLDFQKVLELNKHLSNPHLIHPDQKIETHADHGKGNSTEPNQSDTTAQPPSNHDERIESSEQARNVLELVNAERTKRDITPLVLDDQLNSVAAAKAKDMVENRYFSHNSPKYGTPFEMMNAFGVTYRSAAENIAAGQRTPEEVMESWMNSSGHRENILNPAYTKLGVGFAKGGQYGTCWCQEFTG